MINEDRVRVDITPQHGEGICIGYFYQQEADEIVDEINAIFAAHLCSCKASKEDQ